MSPAQTDRSYVPRMGDHVRVALTLKRDCDESPHFVGEDCLVGSVVVVAPPGGVTMDHRYLVSFDCAVTCALRSGRPIVVSARYYAAGELELVA